MEQRRIKKYKAAAIREEHGGPWSRWWPVLAVAAMMWGLVFVAAHQIGSGDTEAQPVCELVEMPHTGAAR